MPSKMRAKRWRGEEARRTEVEGALAEAWRDLLCVEVARFFPTIRGPCHTLCREELLAGCFLSELDVLSKNTSQAIVARFLSFWFPQEGFVPRSEACAL